jgi:hypothetical protein
MLKEGLQFFLSMGPDYKTVIYVSVPYGRFLFCRVQSLLFKELAARRGSTTVNSPPTNLTVCGYYKTGLIFPAAAGRKTRDRRVVC